MSTEFASDFGPKDPIRALYLAYKTGHGDPSPGADPQCADPARHLEEPVAAMDRQQLVSNLDHELRAQSAWTLFFHASVAERLRLNPTDHKCLDMIWRCYDTSDATECMTPGQLARETKLTTGAVTGVLDRLEHAGYVVREHDPEDRRRIIVRPVPERIKADIQPLFDRLSAEFEQLCNQYTDEELRRLIEFSRSARALLQRATEHLRELEGA